MKHQSRSLRFYNIYQPIGSYKALSQAICWLPVRKIRTGQFFQTLVSKKTPTDKSMPNFPTNVDALQIQVGIVDVPQGMVCRLPALCKEAKLQQ